MQFVIPLKIDQLRYIQLRMGLVPDSFQVDARELIVTVRLDHYYYQNKSTHFYYDQYKRFMQHDDLCPSFAPHTLVQSKKKLQWTWLGAKGVFLSYAFHHDAASTHLLQLHSHRKPNFSDRWFQLDYADAKWTPRIRANSVAMNGRFGVRLKTRNISTKATCWMHIT